MREYFGLPKLVKGGMKGYNGMMKTGKLGLGEVFWEMRRIRKV